MDLVTKNSELIARFYDAFSHKDFVTMQQCYADNATFSDAVFQTLDATQVRAMWEMLIKSGKDFKLEYRNILADDQTGSAEWIGNYTFSQTGNYVENHIKAKFVFENNLIVQHLDSFDFYRWASQALGLKGKLLGWTSFLQKKVQQSALERLTNFIKTK